MQLPAGHSAAQEFSILYYGNEPIRLDTSAPALIWPTNFLAAHPGNLDDWSHNGSTTFYPIGVAANAATTVHLFPNPWEPC